ncbi:tRNA pseudouridine synthase A [Arenicella chitinivorans]|uniref:tRNA pseudouridine synthase A n=1 Tax=Arenicella chitinivorans TaxID=1329800 RepID=A0A918RIW9_9GAMM|nr:tRNA pseudouridine(38-40) synthase TruA [Arenicella chitinivorans]GHA00740.1 tRNA pseudouridine synthase A [Arenicella chitinivorans]
MTRRYAACVEYDGSAFSGWQTQLHDVRTVQETVEAALSRVANQEIAIVTAGRTDTGVHATHQVIHFDTDVERSEFAWCRGTNRFLDQDVRMNWVHESNLEFHARFGALSRSYRFVIYNAPIASALHRHHVTHEFRPLDIERMVRASRCLLGEHDFSAFRAAGCQAHSPVRTVTNLSLNAHGAWIWIDITANAFLQHMVRNIAGSLIEVGYGKRSADWLADVLESRDRKRAGVTAPPHGLYLVGVTYPSQFSLPSEKRSVAYWADN